THNLGTITGFITMIHHMSGGLGAYLGALNYDYDGNYDLIFLVMLLLSALAVILVLPLGKMSKTTPYSRRP
ncbi:MAG: hypothetical protein ACR2PH_07960, partial [Desulfobulbia bacterium]